MIESVLRRFEWRRVVVEDDVVVLRMNELDGEGSWRDVSLNASFKVSFRKSVVLLSVRDESV